MGVSGFVSGELNAVGLCWPSVRDPNDWSGGAGICMDWSGGAGICMEDDYEVGATSLVCHKDVEARVMLGRAYREY